MSLTCCNLQSAILEDGDVKVEGIDAICKHLCSKAGDAGAGAARDMELERVRCHTNPSAPATALDFVLRHLILNDGHCSMQIQLVFPRHFAALYPAGDAAVQDKWLNLACKIAEAATAWVAPTDGE